MKGEVEFLLGGQNCVLVYDWNAILLLEEKFGADKLNEALSSNSIKNLAIIMECGLKKHHPSIKAEAIFEISPNIMECKKAVDNALSLAYFGSKDPKHQEKSNVKKKLLKALLLLGLISALSASALHLIYFGN